MHSNLQASSQIHAQRKNTGKHRHHFKALIVLNTLPRPLSPPQECPRKCGIHRSYHDGVGNRCFRFCHRESVWSHASGRSMQPERTKGGDNYQHGVIRLRGRVGRVRPEHDVADTREGSRRFRVRVRKHLPGQGVYIFIYFSLISFPALFIAVSCHFILKFQILILYLFLSICLCSFFSLVFYSILYFFSC